MGTTANELYLLTCLHTPATKDFMINTVSVTVYQSTETQYNTINAIHSQLITKKKHTHNSLMTFISFAPLNIMVVFFPQPLALKAHLFLFPPKT